VYFLTDQQSSVVASVVRAAKRTTVTNTRRFLVVGGPGTGKTSVLAKLLVQLRAEGRRPGLIVSDEVAKYIESGGAIRLADSRLTFEELLTNGPAAGEFDVLLFDDPSSVWEIEKTFDQATGRYRAVVVAFDPSQLDSDITDDLYDTIVRVLDAKPYQLRSCYRQKENLGRAAKRVIDTIAASTPFGREDRIDEFRSAHDLVYRLSNDLTYPNRFGYEQIYRKARIRDVRSEVGRIRARPLWRHTPPLLLVVQRETEAASWPWESLLAGLAFTQVELDQEEYGDLTAVKGLEFQHAFLAIGSGLHDELEDGFKRSGQRRYHRRRLLRIPFSRAKDSMVTFVTPDH
jgi:hypothetical protein